MRKIEQQVINALRNQENFHSGNTTVEQLPLAGQVSIMHCDLVGDVYLHGNHIARFNRSLNQLEIFDGGWRSRTTASRLNALLSEFAPAYRVVQRKHCWYIDHLNEDKETLTPWDGHGSFRAGSKV